MLQRVVLSSNPDECILFSSLISSTIRTAGGHMDISETDMQGVSAKITSPRVDAKVIRTIFASASQLVVQPYPNF